MAIYRTVQMSFWTDTKIVDDFTPEDKYFYLYLFTNPHTNLCGSYEISKNQISIELGYTKEVVERLINRFKNIHCVIDYDENTKEIIIFNWYKYNWTKSDKLKIALLKEIKQVKNKDFKKYLMEKLNGIDTVSIPYQYGMDTTVTVTDTVTNTNTITNNKGEKNKGFTPPTLEEVKNYCKERNNGVNADNFIDFYSSKGWFIGKNKMKDWKAAVRTWEKRENKTLFNSKSHYDFEELEREIKEPKTKQPEPIEQTGEYQEINF